SPADSLSQTSSIEVLNPAHAGLWRRSGVLQQPPGSSLESQAVLMYGSSASINRTREIESTKSDAEPNEPRAPIAQRNDKTAGGSVAECLCVEPARSAVCTRKNQSGIGVRIPRAWKLHNVYTGAEAASGALCERDHRPAGWGQYRV